MAGIALKKGQTSVEFLFLFLIMIISINMIIRPVIAEAQEAVTDTHRLGQARLAVKQISNLISEAAATSGNTKRTAWIFIESDTNISCNHTENLISFKVPYRIRDIDPADPDSQTLDVTEYFKGDQYIVGMCDGTHCTGSELLRFPDKNGEDVIFLDCDNFRACDTNAFPDCDFVQGDYLSIFKVEVTKRTNNGEAELIVNIR